MSALADTTHSRSDPDLLQYFRERGLVNLNELLQLVQIIAEQAKAFVQGYIARGQLRSRRGPGLQDMFLVEECTKPEFELQKFVREGAARSGFRQYALLLLSVGRRY